MSSTPQDRRFTSSHEWARQDEGHVVIGITEHAVHELGDLVFIDLPDVGTELTAGESFGEIESVKAVAELNAPISGKVTEVNEDLENSLQTLSDSPYEDGWMVRIEPSDPDEISALMPAGDYDKHIDA